MRPFVTVLAAMLTLTACLSPHPGADSAYLFERNGAVVKRGETFLGSQK